MKYPIIALSTDGSVDITYDKSDLCLTTLDVVKSGYYEGLTLYGSCMNMTRITSVESPYGEGLLDKIKIKIFADKYNRFNIDLRFGEERSFGLEDIKSILIAKAKQYPAVYKTQWDDLDSFEKEMSELESMSELLSAFS